MKDRRASKPLFPMVALGLVLYLMSFIADLLGTAIELRVIDIFALAMMAAGTVVALRSALPALEDLLNVQRSLAPGKSALLVTYALGTAVLFFLSVEVREAQPSSHWIPMMLTWAAFVALLAFGRVQADRAGRSELPLDLSRTQRIARASLDF